MSRAKTQNPTKGAPRKRLVTPPQLTPIDEEDVDDAFAAIRMDSEPVEEDSALAAMNAANASKVIKKARPVDADADAAAAAIADLAFDDDGDDDEREELLVDSDLGEDFAPKLAEAAEVRVSTKRAPTLSEGSPSAKSASVTASPSAATSAPATPAPSASPPSPSVTPPKASIAAPSARSAGPTAPSRDAAAASAKKGPPKPPPGKRAVVDEPASADASPRPDAASPLPPRPLPRAATNVPVTAPAPVTSPPRSATDTGGPSLLSKMKAAASASEKPSGGVAVRDPASKPKLPPPSSNPAPPSTAPSPRSNKPTGAPAPTSTPASAPSAKPAPAKVAAKPAPKPAAEADAFAISFTTPRPPPPTSAAERPSASLIDAPPTIVSPNPLAALDAITELNRKSSPVVRAESPVMETIDSVDIDDVDDADDVGDIEPIVVAHVSPAPLRDSSEGIDPQRRFPRGESAVMAAAAYPDSKPAPRKRAESVRAESDFDIDDAADLDPAVRRAPSLHISDVGPPRPPTIGDAKLPRAASYAEISIGEGRGTAPAAAISEPPQRDSVPDLRPVPTQVLDRALRFDSDPGVGFQPVPTAILDNALRMDDDESGIRPSSLIPPLRPAGKAPLPPPGVAPKPPSVSIRLDSIDDSRGRAESVFDDFSSPAVAEDSGFDDEDDFSDVRELPRAPAPRADSALERALRDSLPEMHAPPLGRARAEPPALAELAEPPMLQLAVYETSVNLQAASVAIEASGHAMAVGASGKAGLEEIGIALADGEIDAILVGIPGGEVLINAALSLSYAPIIIAASSGTPNEAVREAHAAGADLVALRPHDAERLAPVLLAAARLLEQRRDMAVALSAQRDPDLLARLESRPEDPEVRGLLSFDAFQRALELELKRVRRYQYALSLALFSLEIPATQPVPPGIKGILRARAGNALLHSIRDIDMATELDQDRFLVLLPYTDLTGATEVARRIIAAVGGIPPIAAGGHEIQPTLVGAIAGTKPGQQLSFNKLIRDATLALEQARRDGAELAVQP